MSEVQQLLMAYAMLFIGTAIGCAGGWSIRHASNEVAIPDQRTCGTARAEHVWVSRETRLVVCETPGGLVVREVLP